MAFCPVVLIVNVIIKNKKSPSSRYENIVSFT